MGNIINNTAFVGRFLVANGDVSPVSVQLNYLVTTFQEQYLRMLLGPVYYQEFITWYDTPVVDRPVNATWSGLLDGTTFTDTYQRQQYLYPLANALTAFCYDRWNRQNLSQTVSMGEVATDSQNASPASATYKVVDRWNEMVEIARTQWLWLDKQLGSEANWVQWKQQQYNWNWGYYADYYPNEEIFNPINRLDL